MLPFAQPTCRIVKLGAAMRTTADELYRKERGVGDQKMRKNEAISCKAWEKVRENRMLRWEPKLDG
jgi:hypothetical protein